MFDLRFFTGSDGMTRLQYATPGSDWKDIPHVNDQDVDDWPDETVELADDGDAPFPGNVNAPRQMASLEDDIRWAINKHSREGGSDTPDFVLAEYLTNCLLAFESAIAHRGRFSQGEAKVFPFQISND